MMKSCGSCRYFMPDPGPFDHGLGPQGACIMSADDDTFPSRYEGRRFDDGCKWHEEAYELNAALKKAAQDVADRAYIDGMTSDALAGTIKGLMLSAMRTVKPDPYRPD